MIDVVNLPSFPPMLGKKIQLAFVVSDLDAAMEYWTQTLKVGPFVVIEHSVGGRKVLHRGQRTDMDMSLAFSYMGDIQIELVKQTNDSPSPYKDFLDSGRQGLHHIAFWPEDFQAACTEVERSGFTEVCAMYLEDGTRNVCYYDTPTHLGIMIEVVPMTPARTSYFGRMKKLTENWDGTRPVRRYSTRADFLESGEGA